MAKFRFIFSSVVLVFIFSCKAPSAVNNSSTSQNNQTIEEPGITTINDPGKDKLEFPIWWVEESYKNGQKKGSPTVIVFSNKDSRVLGRTQSTDNLTHKGSFSRNGGKVTLVVPDVYFGAQEDGTTWNGTIIYNGKILYPGKPDFDEGIFEKLSGYYKGTGDVNLISPIGGLPANTYWIWNVYAEKDRRRIYITVEQQKPSGITVTGDNPIDQERKAYPNRGHFLRLSEFGDNLLASKSNAEVVPGHESYIPTDFELNFAYTGNWSTLTLLLKVKKNAHLYTIQPRYPNWTYEQEKKENNGSKGVVTLSWDKPESSI